MSKIVVYILAFVIAGVISWPFSPMLAILFWAVPASDVAGRLFMTGSLTRAIVVYVVFGLALLAVLAILAPAELQELADGIPPTLARFHGWR